MDGIFVGFKVGTLVGVDGARVEVGGKDGAFEGMLVGELGLKVGRELGKREGEFVGKEEGEFVGYDVVGDDDGTSDGVWLGI